MKIQFNIISNIFKIYLILIVIVITVTIIFAYSFYVEMTVTGKGIISSKNCVEIKSDFDGVIKEVFVTDGQQVEKGQNLLIIEENNIDPIKSKTNRKNIQSPINGFVLNNNIQNLIGTEIKSGGSLLSIGNNDEFIIKAVISEKEISLIKPRQKAKVQIISFPKGEYQLLSAKVLTVSSAGINNFTFLNSKTDKENITSSIFPVILVLEKPYNVKIFNQDYMIKHGFSVEIEITTSHEKLINLVLQRVLRLKGIK